MVVGVGGESIPRVKSKTFIMALVKIKKTFKIQKILFKFVLIVHSYDFCTMELSILFVCANMCNFIGVKTNVTPHAVTMVMIVTHCSHPTCDIKGDKIASLQPGILRLITPSPFTTTKG